MANDFCFCAEKKCRCQDEDIQLLIYMAFNIPLTTPLVSDLGQSKERDLSDISDDVETYSEYLNEHGEIYGEQWENIIGHSDWKVRATQAAFRCKKERIYEYLIGFINDFNKQLKPINIRRYLKQELDTTWLWSALVSRDWFTLVEEKSEELIKKLPHIDAQTIQRRKWIPELTPDERLNILRMLNKGVPYAKIGSKYNMNADQIGRIAREEKLNRQTYSLRMKPRKIGSVGAHIKRNPTSSCLGCGEEKETCICERRSILRAKAFEIGRIEGTYEPDPLKEFISSHHCFCDCQEECQDRVWREGTINKCAICKDKNPMFGY